MFRTIEISDERFEHDGLRCVTVKSGALRGRGDVTVWAPSGVTPRALVILLHGVYGSHWCWALKGGAHRTASRLIASGAIPPLAIAMPGDGLRGDGTAYSRHGDGVDFERWVVEEVPVAASIALAAGFGEPALPSLALQAGAPLFIAGLSMGGFGALRLGARHPDRFAGVSGHSSITHVSQMTQFIEEELASLGMADADASVLDAIVSAGASLPPLRFDCGTADQLLDANRELHRSLLERDVRHEYKEYPGGHEWPYWEAHIEDSFRFFGRVLPTS